MTKTKKSTRVTKPAKPRKRVASSKRAKRAKRPKKQARSTSPPSDDDRVACEVHGDTPPTYVCTHVANGVACGFHANPPAPDDPWPDAWCDLCEAAFQAAGGEWTEASESSADIQLLCTHCYEEARARNKDVPALARGPAAELIHHAVHHAQALQDKSDKQWHWRKMARWDMDYGAGTITFSDPSHEPVVADVRFVGSYSTNSSSFQWAWETYDPDAREAQASSQLRVFGEVRGLSQLTTPNWECDETTAWEMTSLAAYILGADSVYRIPSDHLLWFMLLSNWRRPN